MLNHRSPTRSARCIAWGTVPLMCLFTLLGGAASGQNSVGVIVALSGQAEIMDPGRREAASVGMPVRIGSSIRTAADSELRLALHDGTLLQFSPRTEARIEGQGFDAARGRIETTIRLVQGRIQPSVKPAANNHFKIVSATAAAAMHAGEFVIEYDEPAAVTYVTGIQGEVAVHSVFDAEESEVLVTAQQMSSVRHGGTPAPLRRVERLAVSQIGREDGALGSSLPEAVLWRERLTTGNQVSPLESFQAVTASQVANEVADRPRQTSVKDGDDVSSLLGQNLSDGVPIEIDLGR